jgi:hypothetical protein
MKSVLVLFALFWGFITWSQEDVHFCAQSKMHSKHARNKTLTAIEETKANAYDVHFYDLDLNMTNQSTSISGTASIHGTLLQNLDTILLELFPTQIISELRINGVPSNYTRVNSLLKVGINQGQGSNFVISVTYAGTPPTSVQNPFGGSGVSNANVSTISNKLRVGFFEEPEVFKRSGLLS